MKTTYRSICLAVCVALAKGAGLTLPEDDSSIQEFLNIPPVPAATPEDLAVPPAGEVQKLYLREVDDIRAAVGAHLAAAPEGAEGKGSPWFTKLQAWKAGLDQLSASRLQADAFARIPQMEEAFLEQDAGTLPDYFRTEVDLMNSLGRTLVSAISRHIVDHNATVDAARLAEFVTVFKIARFSGESHWEDEVMPLNAAGVMILDAPAVVTLLKSGPWQQASEFLSGETLASECFSRYAPGGNGLQTLKTKYAANQALIDAKFTELKEWVDQQEAANR